MILNFQNFLIREFNENKTIVYRGAPSPEFGKGNWKGVFVSTDLKSAQQYHENIYKYELSDCRLLDENDTNAEKLADYWLDNSKDPDVKYVNEIDDLWMFPPDGWINHLRKLGYDGMSFGMDRFIFNTDKLKFIISI